MTEMRCRAKMHGIIVADGVVEVKCDSRFCKGGRDVTVLHRFNTHTGELIETLTFRNPKKGAENVGSSRPSAIRTA